MGAAASLGQTSNGRSSAATPPGCRPYGDGRIVRSATGSGQERQGVEDVRGATDGLRFRSHENLSHVKTEA